MSVDLKLKRGRDWCFTSYNLDNYELFKNIKGAGFVKYQVEICPDTERKHIQGFVQFKDGKTMSSVKKIMNDNTIHLEMRNRSVEKAAKYCEKDDSRDENYERVEYGCIMRNTQGARNDIVEMYDMIKNGCTIDELKEYNITTYTKYWRAMEKLYNDEQAKSCGKFKKVEVNLMYGASGTGKTSYVFDKHGAENVYTLEQSNNDTMWFNGYNGHKVLLIDDFYGWIKYSYMLRLLDGYKMRLEVKGGFTYSNWDYIYITSNASPENWYKDGLKDLHRRIDNVLNVPEYGRIVKENKKYKLCKQTVELRNWTIEEEDDELNINVGGCTEVGSNTKPTINCVNITPTEIIRGMMIEKNYIIIIINGDEYFGKRCEGNIINIWKNDEEDLYDWYFEE